MPKKSTPDRPKVGRKPLPMPDPIPDSPINVVKAILNTPQKKPSEWRFMKRKK